MYLLHAVAEYNIFMCACVCAMRCIMSGKAAACAVQKFHIFSIKYYYFHMTGFCVQQQHQAVVRAYS